MLKEKLNKEQGLVLASIVLIVFVAIVASVSLKDVVVEKFKNNATKSKMTTLMKENSFEQLVEKWSLGSLKDSFGNDMGIIVKNDEYTLVSSGKDGISNSQDDIYSETMRNKSQSELREELKNQSKNFLKKKIQDFFK